MYLILNKPWPLLVGGGCVASSPPLTLFKIISEKNIKTIRKLKNN
jgi:hypothetical protein